MTVYFVIPSELFARYHGHMFRHSLHLSFPSLHDTMFTPFVIHSILYLHNLLITMITSYVILKAILLHALLIVRIISFVC